MAWEELRKIVGNVWNPGAHVPFDPKAVKLGQKWKLELIVMNGKNLKNFNQYLHNEKRTLRQQQYHIYLLQVIFQRFQLFYFYKGIFLASLLKCLHQ